MPRMLAGKEGTKQRIKANEDKSLGERETDNLLALGNPHRAEEVITIIKIQVWYRMNLM